MGSPQKKAAGRRRGGREGAGAGGISCSRVFDQQNLAKVPARAARGPPERPQARPGGPFGAPRASLPPRPLPCHGPDTKLGPGLSSFPYGELCKPPQCMASHFVHNFAASRSQSRWEILLSAASPCVRPHRSAVEHGEQRLLASLWQWEGPGRPHPAPSSPDPPLCRGWGGELIHPGLLALELGRSRRVGQA